MTDSDTDYKRKKKRKYHKKKYQQTERVKEQKRELKILEERKTEKHKFIRNMWIEDIQK